MKRPAPALSYSFVVGYGDKGSATCGGSDTLGETLAGAFRAAAFHLREVSGDDGDTGHVSVCVEVHQRCAACLGSGYADRKPGMRRLQTPPRCRACKGHGLEATIASFHLNRIDLGQARIVDRDTFASALDTAAKIGAACAGGAS